MFILCRPTFIITGIIIMVDLYACPFLLQAQLVDLRSELTDEQAERAVVEREVHDQLLQLHALQLQLHVKQGTTEDSDSIKEKLVGTTESTTCLTGLNSLGKQL